MNASRHSDPADQQRSFPRFRPLADASLSPRRRVRQRDRTVSRPVSELSDDGWIWHPSQEARETFA